MKSVKSAITALLVAATMAMPVAARTVRDFFASEQNGIFITLPQDERLDMLDYYEAGQNVPATNNFGGTATIDTLTTDYLKLQTSGSTLVEMLMTTSKRDTVIYVVQTALLPSADSHVAAYDTEWNELNTDKYFKMPQLADFISIPKGDKTRKDDLVKMVKMPTIECSFDLPDRTITATPTISGTMTNEDYDALKPYLAKSITYKLKNVKFKQLSIDN